MIVSEYKLNFPPIRKKIMESANDVTLSIMLDTLHGEGLSIIDILNYFVLQS